MAEIFALLAQHGALGAISAALFVYTVRREKQWAKDLETLHAQHATEIARRDDALAKAHDMHKADLKEASKNAIALHADMHETLAEMSRYLDVAEKPQLPPGRRPPR